MKKILALFFSRIPNLCTIKALNYRKRNANACFILALVF